MSLTPHIVKRSLLPFAGLTAAFLCFSLFQLNRQDLDKDERTTSRVLRYEFTDLVRDRFVAGHPPLYFAALWGWVRVTGHTYGSIAAFSILAGLAGLMVILALGRELDLRGWSWAAGLLWSVHPAVMFHVRYLRPYAGVMALSAAVLLVALSALRRPGPRVHLAVLMVGLIGSFWNHSLLLVWIGVAVAALLVPALRSRLAAAHAGLFVAIVSAHLTLLGLCRLSRAGEHPLAWIPEARPGEMLEVLLQLLGGAHLHIHDVEIGWLPALLLPVALLGVASSRSMLPTPAADAAAAWRFIALATLIPLALLLLVSFAGQSLLQPRYLVILMPGLLLCVVRCLSLLPRRPAIMVLALLLVLPFALASLKVNDRRRTGMRAVIGHLDAQFSPATDVVFFIDFDPAEPLRLFTAQTIPGLPLPAAELPDVQEASVRSAIRGRSRAWVVLHRKADLPVRLPISAEWGEPDFSRAESRTRLLRFNLMGTPSP